MEALELCQFFGETFNFVLERILVTEIMFSDKNVNGSVNDIPQNIKYKKRKKPNHLINKWLVSIGKQT